MPFHEAVRLALQQIRVQKLKSFFTLLGVMIGVMFLIAVVSIVTGMSKYVEEDFAGRVLGASCFTGILFGMLPAARAAKLDPVAALRYE